MSAAKEADQLMRPVFREFKRQARAAIEAATEEVRNVLRVRYDAPAVRLPQGIPAPRLQLRWSEGDDQYEWECSYELVLPLGELDCRNDAKTNHAVIELGRTRVSGGAGRPWQRGTPDMCMPFRDGAHARWDSAALNGLPIYILAPDGSTQLVAQP